MRAKQVRRENGEALRCIERRGGEERRGEGRRKERVITEASE